MTIPVARRGTEQRDRLRAQLPRQLSRLLVLLLLTLAAGVGFAGTAAAHNVLTSSDPTDGSTLQTAPTSVRLTFDQPVQDFEPIVSIIGPDGTQYESGTPVVDSTEVTATVGTLPVAGAYSIAYRVVSADGHPVQGEIKFELAESAVQAPVPTPAVPEELPAESPAATSAAASSGSSGAAASGGSSSSAPSSSAEPTAAPSAATSTAVATTSSSSGLSGWAWAAIALAGALIVAAIVVIVRRPQRS